MMQKIISFEVDDLAVDAEEVVNTINNACTKRHDKYKVRGICQIEPHVYFVLLPLRQHEEPERYVLIDVQDTSHDGFVALLNERWSADFDTVGTIEVYEDTKILFATARH